jgi:arylsulfatase A-like enzyme
MDLYEGKNYAGTKIPIPGVEARYASMVTGVDAALERLLETLESDGRAENTLVVFTSYNGVLSEHARGTTPRGTGQNSHCWPLRDGKASAYEGGICVPLLVAWARTDTESAQHHAIPTSAGTRGDEPVICEDIFATLVNRAGASSDKFGDIAIADKLSPPVIDGRNWTELLAGGMIGTRPFLFHYPHVWGPRGPGYQPHSSIIAGDWDAIYFYQPRR